MALLSSPKMTSLLAAASLAMAYVRNILQYRRYSWDSWLEFFVTWFVHYVAIGLVVAVAYGIMRSHEKRLLGDSENLRRLTMEEAIIFASLLVIVGSAAVYVLAHWVPVDID